MGKGTCSHLVVCTVAQAWFCAINISRRHQPGVQLDRLCRLLLVPVRGLDGVQSHLFSCESVVFALAANNV